MPDVNTDPNDGGATAPAPEPAASLTPDPAATVPNITAPPPAQPSGTFKDQLPDDLKNLETLKDIKTVADLAKSFDHAQRMIGKSRLEMPSESDPPEAWNDFYKSLGRPDSGKDYQLWDGAEPKLPEGVVRDEKMEEFFRNKMHERGLSGKQAKELYNDFMEFQGLSVKHAAETMQQTRAAWAKETREMFGLAHDEKVGAAQQVVEVVGDPVFNKLLDQTGLSSHPVAIKAFAKLGELMGEHVTTGGGGRSHSSMTPDAARAQIAELQRDLKFMGSYMNETDVGHAEAVKRMSNLHAFAYPELEG